MFLPKAAIFDLDGTLLDSMWVWKKIDSEFLASRGHIVTPDYTDAIKCMGWDEGARYTIDRYGLSETPEQVINAWFDMSEEYYRSKIPMKPYAKEYLAFLHEHGVPMAVATSMEPKKNIDVVIDSNGLRQYFQNITLNNEVSRGKGFPDIFLLAASRLGVDPSECAVFEDILAAVRGAKAGGFQTVGIFDELSAADWPDMQKEATIAASSWKDLL
ncbi:MAG: HAD family phosphatase [Clostridiales bacterium]|nr:HAD family phosphatase [Clostridiales bacterium]MBR5058305.1 HAD family phosphatase [Clostridiales bacterium]